MEGVKYVKYMQITYILPSIQLKCGILNGGTTIFYKIVEKANGKCSGGSWVGVTLCYSLGCHPPLPPQLFPHTLYIYKNMFFRLQQFQIPIKESSI